MLGPLTTAGACFEPLRSAKWTKAAGNAREFNRTATHAGIIVPDTVFDDERS